jgi:hypothetical protein
MSLFDFSGIHVGCCCLESQKGRDHYEDLNVGRWIILKLLLERWDGELIWLRIGTREGFL